MTKMSIPASWWLLHFVLSALVVVVSCQGQSCGLVGSDTGRSVANRDRNFYLNTQDPAPCDGMIDGVQYCYYHTSILNIKAIGGFSFTAALYREMGQGTYTAISDAYTTGTSSLDHGTQSFRCVTVSIPPLQIQAGDVIGVCIYNPPLGLLGIRAQLDVVGRNAGANRFLLRTSNSGCGDSAVPNTVSSLTRENSLVLHISASITPLPTIDSEPPTIPTDPTEPTLSTTTMIETPPTTSSPETPSIIDDSTIISVVEASSTVNGTEDIPSKSVTTTLAGPVSTVLPTAQTTPILQTHSLPTPSPSYTTNIRLVTTLSFGRPPLQKSTANSGVIAAVLVILLLLIVLTVAVTAIVIVIKRQQMRYQAEADGGGNIVTTEYNMAYNVHDNNPNRNFGAMEFEAVYHNVGNVSQPASSNTQQMESFGVTTKNVAYGTPNLRRNEQNVAPVFAENELIYDYTMI